MKKILITIISVLSIFTLAQADMKNHAKEISTKERGTVALSTLKSTQGTIQVYAKGLVCESCGIGIRKKIQKLKFVDTKQPQKGIIMDVKSQLVSISLKEGADLDIEAIKKAVKGAGYEPMALYQLNGGKLKVTSLEG